MKKFLPPTMSIRAAAIATGLTYSTVWEHVHGRRKIKGEYALLYERVLGIPRYELRPDLWPPGQRIPQKEAPAEDDRSEDENL